MIRRRTALSALALPALIGRAHAQAFPDQPVRLIVPFAAGGPADLIARTVGRAMGEKLGKPVVVEARAGAGGLIGIDYVAKSRPDGHTLVLASSGGMVILPHLQPSMPYDPRTDLSPITQVLAVPQIVSISPGLGPRNLAELVALAKARPGQLAYGSAGIGSSLHLAGELFAAKAKMRLSHVAYKGSAPGLSDTMAGHVPMMFDNLPSALQLIKTGKLRALAVTSSTRSPMLPEVPTMVEAGLPDYAITGWFGAMLRSGTPKPIIERFHSELSAILAMPEISAKLKEMGGIVSGAGPEAFTRFIAAETDKWSKLIKSARISIG